MRDIKEFVEEKISVNCVDLEGKKKFLQLCEDNGIMWSSGRRALSYVDSYNYILTYGIDDYSDKISQGDKEVDGFKLVSYTEFFPIEFKVGDIICGKKGCRMYCVTDERMRKGIIENIDPKDGELRVKILEHDNDCEEGEEYWVYPQYFELVEDEISFKIGDIVCGIEGSPYNITNEKMSKGIVERINFEDGEIEIKIIKHENASREGYTHCVLPKYFNLVESAEIKEEITISLEKDKKSVLMVYKRDNTAVREERFKLGDGVSFMDAAKDILDNFDNDRIEYSLSSLEDTNNAITWESQEEFIELMDRIFGGDNGNDLALYIEDGTIVIDDMDFLDMGGYNFIPYSKVTMD